MLLLLPAGVSWTHRRSDAEMLQTIRQHTFYEPRAGPCPRATTTHARDASCALRVLCPIPVGVYAADTRRERPRRCDGDAHSAATRERLRACKWRAKVVAFIGAASWSGVRFWRLGTYKQRTFKHSSASLIDRGLLFFSVPELAQDPVTVTPVHFACIHYISHGRR